MVQFRTIVLVCSDEPFINPITVHTQQLIMAVSGECLRSFTHLMRAITVMIYLGLFPVSLALVLPAFHLSQLLAINGELGLNCFVCWVFYYICA
jgi:hypothetical protein